MEKKTWKLKLGIILISVSVLIFLTLFVIPFVGGFDLRSKFSASAIVIIAGEAMYWIGTLLIGKELWNKYKDYIKSGEWLEKKK